MTIYRAWVTQPGYITYVIKDLNGEPVRLTEPEATPLGQLLAGLVEITPQREEKR